MRRDDTAHACVTLSHALPCQNCHRSQSSLSQRLHRSTIPKQFLSLAQDLFARIAVHPHSRSKLRALLTRSRGSPPGTCMVACSNLFPNPPRGPQAACQQFSISQALPGYASFMLREPSSEASLVTWLQTPSSVLVPDFGKNYPRYIPWSLLSDLCRKPVLACRC
jgi:hypothetical protein